MYRFLVVLVTVAAAKGDYSSSFGYPSFSESLSSLSHQGGYYSPPPQQPLGLGHFSQPSGFHSPPPQQPISHFSHFPQQPPPPQQPISHFSHFPQQPPPPPPPQQPLSLSHFSHLPPPPPPPPQQPIDLDHYVHYQPKVQSSGGDYSDRSQFESGKSGQNDHQFAVQNGQQGDQFDKSSNGFQQGNADARAQKADSGFFTGENGEKRFSDDGKHYFGDKQFQQHGKNEASRKANSGHRKGQSVKGFKKSHHLDENGKEEQFFDEQKDEGEHFNVNGEAGSFGEKQESAFKGAQENSELRGNQGGQKQHFENQQSFNKNHGSGDQYDSRKFGGDNSNFSAKNGGGQESLQGHSSESKSDKHQSF